MTENDEHRDFEHQAYIRDGKSSLKLDRAKGVFPGSTRPNAAPPRRRELSVEDYVTGVLNGDRAVLGRAISLIESNNARHAALAQQVLTGVMDKTGGSFRVGITGVPGAGKSTFIEQLGVNLIEQGHRVAVLAVDPSSSVSGGSVLGDKTRMSRLGADDRAFIRPSPAAGTLGGVARKTRETMLICEAAGFDVVLVETVGVGQSETVVAEMTDFFLGIMIPGAGDELQGIKRGLLELVNLIAVNKAEGDNAKRAEQAANEYENALHYTQTHDRDWKAPVVTCSALHNINIDRIWDHVREHRRTMQASGRFETRRREQALRWVWSLVEDRLKAALREHPDVRAMLASTEADVLQGRVPPTLAAERILGAFLGSRDARSAGPAGE